MPVNGSPSCPCHSSKIYKNCCQKYHKGRLPETALALMRSRFSAYALGLTSYIIETTDSKSPHYVHNRAQWEQQIALFSKQVSFNNLEIIEVQLGQKESFVTFVAYLSKDHTDLTFTEKSRFIKEESAWKYVEGKIGKGKLSVKEIESINLSPNPN